MLPIGAQSIVGTIVDQQGTPVHNAHVFISNSFAGTTSAADGRFKLEHIPSGPQTLIVSHLSFEPLTHTFVQLKEESFDRIVLEERITEVHGVTVAAAKSNKRKRWLKSFQRALIGASPNARFCSIENPEVILFWEEDGALQAQASDLIRIRNGALGYRLHFLLEFFRMKGVETQYAGKPLFEELEQSEEKGEVKWERNRNIAYQGSKEHFFRSLLSGRLHEEGFEIHHTRLVQGNQFEVLGTADPSHILQITNERVDLKFREFLRVIYTRERSGHLMLNSGIGDAKSSLGRPAEKDMIDQEANDFREVSKAQTSFLFLVKSKVGIDASGRLTDPVALKEYGYWTTEGLADLLPSVGSLNKNNIETEQPGERKNGFLLSNLKIPVDEIHHGGPPRDGIPSIDQPKFDLPSAARITDKDPVLGVIHHGVAKAYPVRIMDWHEIVNDEFDGEKVVITYCPLCGSGMAFEAEIKGRVRTFGVSGLLYNSDVLLYDRETESLWSQIMSQAVSGNESGTALQLIPTYYTSWGAWKDHHPSSLVLSPQTGYNRDYNKSPYIAYEWDQTLMFPVSLESKEMKRKDRIIGISLNGKHKAYSIKRLRKQDILTWDDQIGGQDISLVYDTDAEILMVTDNHGKIVPTTTMFWFAWYAFHPDTDMY